MIKRIHALDPLVGSGHEKGAIAFTTAPEFLE